MKFCFVLDFEGKDTYYFDTLFSKTIKKLLFSIKFPKIPTFRKYILQICSILPKKREIGDSPQFHIFTKNHYFYILSNDY